MAERLINDKLNKLFKKVESAWLAELFLKNKELFEIQPLPSHDHTHHLRVWLHAKELLIEMYDKGIMQDETDILKLLISVFFHDTGLTRTHKSDHGIESRFICEQFLSGRGGVSAEDMSDILLAVEKHDDKSYIGSRNKIDLCSLLSVSDDLDAYGAIGVYRYFEIYRLRGISEVLIPSRVNDNLVSRFGFFEKNFVDLKNYVRKHKIRKNYTLQFFKQFTGNDNEKRERAFKSFNTLNLLIQNAFHYKSGLDFLLYEDFNSATEDELSQQLISDLKMELMQVKNKVNLSF